MCAEKVDDFSKTEKRKKNHATYMRGRDNKREREIQRWEKGGSVEEIHCAL